MWNPWKTHWALALVKGIREPWNILAHFCNNTISYTSHNRRPNWSKSNKAIFPAVYSNIFKTTQNTTKDTICIRLLYSLYRCILIYSQAIFNNSNKDNLFLNNTTVNSLVSHTRKEKRPPVRYLAVQVILYNWWNGLDEFFATMIIN